jgi:hypothetical protein
MPKFAVIKNNKVENIILADSLEVAQSVTEGLECVPYIEDGINIPHIGFVYLDGMFEQPIVPIEVIPE